MSKKQSRKECGPAARSRATRMMSAIALALICVVGTSILAQVNLRTKGSGGSSEVSVAGLPAGSPSKEYIYAGVRLIATEEPGGAPPPGSHTVGLYDPGNAAFFLRNSNTGGVADITFTFGPAGSGFMPIVGDWNGDGVDTIGLYDPHMRRSS
jgi:hypothetical protein